MLERLLTLLAVLVLSNVSADRCAATLLPHPKNLI
jgi:hypothetical protein